MRLARLPALATCALLMLAAPLAAEAQPAGKVYRIAYVASVPPTPLAPGQRRYLDAFSLGLRERGWVEGQNIIIEQRYAGGQPGRYSALLAELLQIPVDAIVVADSEAAWAAKQATSTTPIVLVSVTDAVRQGLITSLARPGGNITGIDNQLGDIAAKRLQLLKEIVPTLGRVALVFNPNNPGSNLKPEEDGAPALGIT